MDEELARWAKQWQSQEEREMKIVAKHVGAHQLEGIAFAGVSALYAALGVALAALVVVMLWVGGPLLSGARVAQLLVSIGSLAFGAATVFVWRTQRVRARARLIDTPASIVRDLLLLRERELFWWTDKRVLGATGLWLALCAAVLSVAWHLELARGVPSDIYWVVGISTFVWFAGFAIAGYFRVRFLRADVRALEQVLAEIVDDAQV